MAEGLQVLGGFFGAVWKLMVFLLLVLFGLGALYRVLEAETGAALGGSGAVGRALSGLASLFLLVVLGLVLVPELARAMRGALSVPGCAAGGELFAQLYQAAAGLALALGALRMLKGVLEGMAGAALGAAGGPAEAVRGLLEGVGGLLLLSVVGPLVATFLCKGG